MLKLKRIIITVLPLLLTTGCFNLYDGGSDLIVDDYEITWIDLHESRALYKHEELVQPYVFAVGHNSKFIFAKQHPLLPGSSVKISKSIINYFIIERAKNDLQDKPVYGPLTKGQFENKCTELSIINPEFDVTYPTNL